MKIHQTLSLFITTISLQAQSITFGPATTLFTLDCAHWSLFQPNVPAASTDGKHVDFYGLTGSTYKKHTYTAGNYPATSFMLFDDFNYITDIHDFDGDGKDDILTDADIYRSKGNNVYERVPLGNISYEVEGSLDYGGDGQKDVLVTEDDFSSGLTSLYILPLRDEIFHSIDGLNAAFSKQLDEHKILSSQGQLGSASRQQGGKCWGDIH